MKNPVTTISGILLLIVTIVHSFALITAEQSAAIQDFIPVVIEGVVSIIALFKASDGDKAAGL